MKNMILEHLKITIENFFFLRGDEEVLDKSRKKDTNLLNINNFLKLYQRSHD